MKCATKVAPPQLAFTSGDINGNTSLVLAHLGLEQDSEVPVRQFTIASDGRTSEITTVQAGKYKSALLLYYLASLTRYTNDNPSFTLTEDMRQLVREFFGDEFCNKALSDPDTVHKTIKNLLLGKKVIVTLYLK